VKGIRGRDYYDQVRKLRGGGEGAKKEIRKRAPYNPF